MLRKDTEILRATVTQEIRCILEAESGAAQESVRRVQVLIPMEPKTYLSAVQDADQVFGTDRVYKMPVAPPGAAIIFWLRPNQALFACSDSENSQMSIVVEYHDTLTAGRA